LSPKPKDVRVNSYLDALKQMLPGAARCAPRASREATKSAVQLVDQSQLARDFIGKLLILNGRRACGDDYRMPPINRVRANDTRSPDTLSQVAIMSAKISSSEVFR
jgi:hypothetical protein